MSLNPTVRWDTGFFTSMYGDFVLNTQSGVTLGRILSAYANCVFHIIWDK